jgi:hypothetical protein
MEGGLRHPVRLRILDGSTVIFRAMLLGKTSATDPGVRTFIVDASDTYTVEWAECANLRAPRTLAAATREKKGRESSAAREEGTAYECGEAKVFKTEKLRTVRGNAASHVIHFQAPPGMACWASDAGEPADRDGGAPAADAGKAEAQAQPRVDGGAAPSIVNDAGTASSKPNEHR